MADISAKKKEKDRKWRKIPRFPRRIGTSDASHFRKVFRKIPEGPLRIAHISHNLHNRRWCTFFESVSFFCIIGPFWHIWAFLSWIYALFGVLFTGINSAVVSKNWQISGMVAPCWIMIVHHAAFAPLFLNNFANCRSIFARYLSSIFVQQGLQISGCSLHVAWQIMIGKCISSVPIVPR